MKKKNVAVALTVVMLMSMMACAKTTTNEGANTQTPTSEADVTSSTQGTTEPSQSVEKLTYPIVKDPITVKGLLHTEWVIDTKERSVWKKVEEVSGIKIEWESIDEATLPTYLAGGNWPDFFQMAMPAGIVEDYGVYGGRFVNYLDKLDIMPNLVQLLEDYPMAKRAFSSVNNEMYNLPAIGKSVTGVFARPYFRPDMLEKANVKIPTTVDEFAQALRDLKKFYGKIQWAPVLRDTNSFAVMLYDAFGTGNNMGWDADENENVYYPRASEQMKHYYEFMNMLYEEKLIHQECATLDSNAKKEYDLKDVAFPEQGAAALLPDHFEDGQVHLSCLSPLTSQYDNTRKIVGRSVLSTGVGSFYVNAESKYVDEICRMLDISCAKSEVVEGSGLSGNSFTYGLEGEHWKINEDGETFELYPTSDEMRQTVIYHNCGRFDALGMMVTTTPGNAQQRQIGFRDNVWPYMESEEEMFNVGLLKFTEEEQEVISNKLTEITKYSEQMQVEFITGATDIDTEWDNYCTTLNKMGLPEVVKAYQDAYDRFLGE